jgi:hypothetical protein
LRVWAIWAGEQFFPQANFAGSTGEAKKRTNTTRLMTMIMITPTNTRRMT